MDKKKILSWLAAVWFILNIPFIPFVGTFVYALLSSYFFQAYFYYALLTFVVFLLISLLSKMWLKSFFTTPTFFAFAAFVPSALSLPFVRDLFEGRFVMVYGTAVIIAVVMICVAVIQVMRRARISK